MKPDWDALGEKYEDSKRVIIGDVDCISTGKPLCDKYGVDGYPTLMSFNPPNMDAEKYEGGRTLKDLKKFVKTLGPACTANTLENCSTKQLAKLQPFLDMDPAELQAQYAALKAEVDSAHEAHNALMKTLQEQFEASEKALTALKERSEPDLKLMNAALKVEPPPEIKDEI